jgi:lipid-A-disaccharide synthase
MNPEPRIAIVAGEVSGDFLAAGLMQALRQHWPRARFEGVAGPRMIEAGCAALYPLARLSVMGFAEVLPRLPGILWMRRQLRRRWLTRPPDVFIGVDAPDFNLPLARDLHAAGIRTVHYVSPSVWAWRAERVQSIRRDVDLMLTLFPFEAAFYERHAVPVRFVGHPLADQIPLMPDRAAARVTLGLLAGAEVVALLPGSRKSEVSRLAPVFIDAARLCLERRPGLHFVAPMATPAMRVLFEAALRAAGAALPLTLLDRQAQAALIACDAALVASGTATLEALLCKRPMVVAYRMHPYSWRRMLKLFIVDRYALPNHLAGRDAVPEFYQDACTPTALADALLTRLDDVAGNERLRREFTRVHEALRQDASRQAAAAVAALA